MKLYQPSTIKEINKKHAFRFTKSLGQNFLTDKNIIEDIVNASMVTEDDLVIEIGPGIGVITREAAAKAKKVMAVEIDKNLIPILEETLYGLDNVEIIHADILKTDVNALIKKETVTGKVRIIGNLPYYITTPIIMKLLEEGVAAESITIMVQKEVADRIKAAPGSKDYSSLSVSVQFFCSVSDIRKVPKTVFIPVPQIDSTVLRLDIYKKRPVQVRSSELFFEVVKAGFGQRRKTLLNSLTGVRGLDKETAGVALDAAGIDRTRRAETLSVAEFAVLADEIYERMGARDDN